MNLRKRVERLEATSLDFQLRHLSLRQLKRLLYLHEKNDDSLDFDTLTIQELEEYIELLGDYDESGDFENTIEEMSYEELCQCGEEIEKQLRESGQKNLDFRACIKREIARHNAIYKI